MTSKTVTDYEEQMAGKTHFRPILLSGGGLSARIMALCLARSGYPFFWLSGPYRGSDSRKDNRTTTIHHAGMNMLASLGISDKLAHPACPIERLCVSDRPASATTTSWPLVWEQAEPAMAHVVLNHDLASATEHALSQAGITAHPVDVETVSFTPTIQVIASDGRQYECDLIIGCEGADSKLVASAGLATIDAPSSQTAIVFSVTSTKRNYFAAYQRFLDTGPLAVMPITETTASVVWTLPDKKAEDLVRSGQDAVQSALNSAFGATLGELTIIDAPLLWPLRPRYLPKIISDRLILAGDSAHVLHPLAGMGFNLALADAAVLLDCLNDGFKRGLQAGHPDITTRYQHRRQPEILAMTAVTQMLNKLLSRPTGPLSAVAGLGMGLLGRTIVRDRLKDIAMGGVLSPARLFE